MEREPIEEGSWKEDSSKEEDEGPRKKKALSKKNGDRKMEM